MKKDEFDQLFNEAFEHAANHIPVRMDSSVSWRRVKMALDKQRFKQTFTRKLRIASVIAASMILGAFLLNNPTLTKAFHPFYQTIVNFSDGVKTIFFESNDTGITNRAKTLPPPDITTTTDPTIIENMFGQGMQIDMTSLAEAQQKVSFPLPQFNYIPSGYKFTAYEVYQFDFETGLAGWVIFRFTASDGQYLTIDLKNLLGSSTISEPIQDSSVKKVMINSAEAYLTQEDDGIQELKYLHSDIRVLLSGNISEEELINVAMNLF